MGGGGQAMKRIPLIKFPQRHPIPTPASGSSQNQAAAKEWDAQRTMSDVPAAPINTAAGGKSFTPAKAHTCLGQGNRCHSVGWLLVIFR